MPQSSFIDLNTNQYFYITLVIIIFILFFLFIWIFTRLSLKDKSCEKLNKYWPTLTNISYLADVNTTKVEARDAFDGSHCKLINFNVKSAYNCCCGDGYKNNFVALCALEKSIANGCRFLDFEIYSYNNEPIVAASTANNNYIKETYNSLLLEDVLSTIKEKAFSLTSTNCANDPLILNFRVMSTNLTMLKYMGDLLEKYLKSSNQGFTIETKKDNMLLNTRMIELFKKVIIICDFNPLPTIISNPDLKNLKRFVNLTAKGTHCNTFRYNQIISKKGSASFLTETKSKYVIVLPNLDNSIINFDPTLAFTTGCQAICMKHQNIDNNLLAYNKKFKQLNYSWTKKIVSLLNQDIPTLTNYSGTGVVYDDWGELVQ
jgi:hypothetical protein